MRILLVDGYTDEPAALGVPPYLAPLPRCIAGAALEAGADGVDYITIDQVRAGSRGRRRLEVPRGAWGLMAVVGGAVVPGRYLRGRPASSRELAELASSFSGPAVLCGPVARYQWTSGSPATRQQLEAFDHVATGDGDACVHDLLSGHDPLAPRARTPGEWTRWPVLGASLAAQHPDHPRPLIAEVETYRGCVRHAFGGCSFCTTVRDAPPAFRSPEDVAAEVAALAGAGVVAFRLGGQSCIYSFKAKGVGRTETPTPDPGAVRALLEGVREAAPALEVLHVDNANPAIIAAHPREAGEVTRLLVEHCTGGNVVALGLESADPAVREANNLNSTPEQCLEAIRIVNSIGDVPSDSGLPALLPGINLLAGLRGETPATFEMDMDFLRSVVAEGLLIRRINIRQVAPVCGDFDVRRHHSHFRAFKEAVRREVDLPMLRRLLPYASRLARVHVEVQDGNTSFGRQVGTYPLVVGIPDRIPPGTMLDVRVIDYGFRSVTAVPDPLPINEASMALLASVPGIGRKRAARIVRARPLTDEAALRACLDDPAAAEPLLPLVRF